MADFPLHVRPVFRMLLVLPFRLGADFVPLPAARRRAAFTAVAAELDRSLPAFVWQSVPFDEANPVPDLLAGRKACFLRGQCQQPALTGVGGDAEYPREGFGTPTVREAVWYYDWGLGAVEVEVDLPWDRSKSSSDLAGDDLLKFGNSVAYPTKDRLTFFRDWPACSARLTEALRHVGHAAGPWAEADAAFAGRTYFTGITLTLRTAPAGADALELTEAPWEGLVRGFTGRAASEQGPVHCPGLLAIGEGTGG
jgi:hypothetical protein